MDSLDHLLSPRISQILALNNLACSRSRCSTSGAINKDTSIPDKDISFFIYLDTIGNETSLWGLFMPNKSCLFFISPFSWSIHERSVFFSNAKMSSFGGVLPFLQVFAILQIWTQLFLQTGTWSEYQGDGYLRLWKLMSVPVTLWALR